MKKSINQITETSKQEINKLEQQALEITNMIDTKVGYIPEDEISDLYLQRQGCWARIEQIKNQYNDKNH